MKNIILFILFFFFIIPIRLISADYRVGIDYHATDSNFTSSAFITQYHQPEIRAKVISQLQSMANSGAQIINTRLWFTDVPGSRFPDNHERLGFPLSDQELLNLKQYVQDVGATKLDLYLTLLWNGCGDYVGGYDIYCHYTWDEYITKVKETISQFFSTTGNLTRPDGTKIVHIAYLDGEVMVGAKANTDKFLKEVYPGFIALANQYGITPAIYFIVVGDEASVLDNNYTDEQYPVLNNHRSLFWLYRTTEFMKQNNLPLPNRLDLSFYPTPVSTDYETMVRRVFDDLQDVYPNTSFGISETYYPADAAKRKTLGSAFVQESRHRPLLQELLFWTTPDSGGPGINAGFPFDFKSYDDFNPSGIQQQINNLPSTGGTVNLPSGEYLLSMANGSAEYYPDGTPIQTAILINKDNVILEGQGSNTILKLASHTKMRALSITSQNVTVKNLVIDGNKTQRNGSVPWPNGDVVDALLYASSTASNITIENVEVKNGIEDGVGFWKTQNVLAQNNYSHDNGTPQAGGAGMSLSGVIHATATNNRIENNSATGIWSAFDANDVKILNNTIHNNASGGITIGSGTVDIGLGANNSGFEIKNNILSGNGSAGFASITIFASKNGVLEHNRIDNSSYDNIQIDGTQNMLSTNWTISRNVCSSEPGIRDLGRSQNIVLKSNLCQTNISQQTPPADLDLNTKVDIFDYNLLVSDFGKTGDLISDIDVNQKVDIFDYNILVGNFGKSL